MELALCVVITGNPVDGLSFTGPFNNGPEAIDWCERNLSEDWWIAPLNAQED